ncbi:hypothetical protein Dimus_007200 [Dionaea muscipula]
MEENVQKTKKKKTTSIRGVDPTAKTIPSERVDRKIVSYENLLRLSPAMADDFEFADHPPPAFEHMAHTVKSAEAKGFNPGLIVLLIVGGLLLLFLVGNYFLYLYAHKTLPPKKKKPVSKKKMKKERMKQGVSAPGE